MPHPIAASRSRRFPGVLIAIVALAAAVRLFVIGRDTLWLDEGYSWWDAHQSFHALWTLVPTCDPHPPLYFAVLHGWIAALGDGTVTMRSLSTLFGLATVVVVYAAGRTLDVARGASQRRFGIGALAASLFALTPFQIYFSIESRPYALLCLGAALLTLGCLRTLHAPPPVADGRRSMAWLNRIDRKTAAVLLIGGLIVVWTNNTAVLVLGAASTGFLLLWLIERDMRSTIVPVVLVGLLIGVLWAPDWPLLLAQSREVTQDFWIPQPSLEGIGFELHNLIGLDILRLTWPIAFVIACGLYAVATRIGRRWGLMLGALAVLPIVYNIAVSYAMAPILISRALIGAAPALAIALAAAAIMLRSRGLRLVAVVGLIAMHAYATDRFLSADHVKEPWKPVVAAWPSSRRDAPLLVVPNELVLPLDHEAMMQHVSLTVRGLPADYPATDMAARYPSGKCAPSVIDQDLKPLLEQPARPEGGRVPDPAQQYVRPASGRRGSVEVRRVRGRERRCVPARRPAHHAVRARTLNADQPDRRRTWPPSIRRRFPIATCASRRRSRATSPS